MEASLGRIRSLPNSGPAEEIRICGHFWSVETPPHSPKDRPKHEGRDAFGFPQLGQSTRTPTLSLHPPNRRGISRDRYTSRPSAMGRHGRGGLAEMNNSSRNLNGASHEHSDHCPDRRPGGTWAGGADGKADGPGSSVSAGPGGGLAVAGARDYN